MNTSLQTSKFLLFSHNEEKVFVDVYFKDENIWLTQKLMSQLFSVGQPAIAKHLKNIFENNELEENSVYSILEYTANDGKNYKTKFYNLDAIISVGYRVNSLKATQFRIWATKHLKEFVIKGFVLDDERLKNGDHFGKNYFDELIEKVRDIRTSERNFYQKITDIYALSVNYSSSSLETRNFFATVQNKMHFGIHGKTAAEVIFERVDSNKGSISKKIADEKANAEYDIFNAKRLSTYESDFDKVIQNIKF